MGKLKFVATNTQKMKSKFIFQPILWPTIFFIFSLTILLLLGTWQVKRLFWKNNLINFYIKQFESDIIYLHKDNYVLKDIEYRKIIVNGTFLNEKEIHITGKTYEGNAGFHVITPFLIKNGKYILVNRGWVSESYKDIKSRDFSMIEGETSIKGIIRYPQKKGYFVPNNEPENGFWFTIIPSEIMKFLKFNSNDFLSGFYVDVLRDGKRIMIPIGVKGKPNLRNQHLSYAITWYSLAIVLIIIYFSYHYSEGRLIIRKYNG